MTDNLTHPRSRLNRVQPVRKSTWKQTLWLYVMVVLLSCTFALYFRLQGLKDGLSAVEPALASPLPHTTDIEPSAPPMASASEQERNKAIIKKIWGKDAHVGIAISSCESGLRANAVNRHNTNGTIDVGLFQENSVHGWTEEQMLDPIANAGVAYSQYVTQGLNPWESSKSCWEGRL